MRITVCFQWKQNRKTSKFLQARLRLRRVRRRRPLQSSRRTPRRVLSTQPARRRLRASRWTRLCPRTLRHNPQRLPTSRKISSCRRSPGRPVSSPYCPPPAPITLTRPRPRTSAVWTAGFQVVESAVDPPIDRWSMTVKNILEDQVGADS